MRVSILITPDSVHAYNIQQGFIHLAFNMPLSAPLTCDRFKQELSELDGAYDNVLHTPTLV